MIRRVLKYLVPENVRVTVLSRNSRFFASKVEPHFGTEYHTEKISDLALASWRRCGINPAHRLPVSNALIDRRLAMASQADPAREDGLPELFLLLERIRMKSWYLPATRFGLAKAFSYLQFSCPDLASKDAK